MMKVARRFALLPLVVAGPALAQPAPQQGDTVVVISPQPVVVTGASPAAPGSQEMPPIPQPAPQNETWTNVSHINGQVVPVGERGNYLYKWKSTNIASNPIGWLTGFYGLSVSQAVTSNAAIRGDVTLFSDTFDDNSSGYELGLTVPLYFRRVYSGPFVEGGLMVRDFDSDDSEGASFGPQVMFGWHWTFDSGLNVAFAGGVMRNMNREDDEYGYEGESIEPAWYFRIGYAY
jgi:hypothetical protein